MIFFSSTVKHLVGHDFKNKKKRNLFYLTEGKKGHDGNIFF